MINTTSKIIFLTQPIRPKLLEAVEYCYRVTQDKLKFRKGERSFRHHHIGAALLSLDNIGDTADESFVQNLCDFSAENVFHSAPEVRARVEIGLKRQIPSSSQTQHRMRLLARFILFRLWTQGDILLPLTFKFKSGVDTEAILDSAPDLLRACLTWSSPDDPAAEYRYRYHIPRWLIATTWRRPEDIDLDDALATNRFLNDCRDRKVEFLKSTINPTVRVLLAGLVKTMPERVACTESDLKLWDLYHVSELDRSVRFSDIEAANAVRVTVRNETRSERYANRRKAASARKREATAKLARVVNDSGQWDPEHIAFGLTFKRDEGAWFANTDNLSFLQAQLSPKAKVFWSGLFEQFKKHRKMQKGYESDKVTTVALRTLADYLSICLPAYFSLNAPEETIPTCPREFTRYPFIDGAGGELNAPTFLEYIYRRLAPASQYAVINQLQKFFEFIALNYGNDHSETAREIAGKDFRIPINIEVDQQAQRGTKQRVTNKKPFSSHVVPHLLAFNYAIEQFGMHLQKNKVELAGDRSNTVWLRTADFGFEPTYEHLGQTYPVEYVPFGLVRPQPRQKLASLTRLRMFQFDLETGLRMQAAQWLCKLTFDKANIGITDERCFYWIWINTDKVNDGFHTPVLPRVRDLLNREKADQDSYGVEDVPIYYERREHTRFEQLVPLFRNIGTGQPVSDGYEAHWFDLLHCFHDHFRKHVGLQAFIKTHDRGTREVSYGPDEAPYCPIGYGAIHTPHSCRSTFVTRRTPFIAIGDISTMIGHANSMITALYDYPEAHEAGRHLAFGADIMNNATASEARTKSGPAYIKAHAVNSTMVKSFAENREAAIRDFGFVALKPYLHSDVSADALNIMQESPMAQIIFRPTHVCVVGELCPAEVIKIVGGRRRCGGCPLCVRSVDHLPAIGAYLRQMQERIVGLQRHYSRVAKDRDSASDLAEIYDKLDDEVQEFLAWRVAEDVLGDIADRYGVEADQHLHAFEPDFVRDHVKTIVRTCSEKEFVLRRIMDSDAYPAMSTERVEAQALRIKQEIMAFRDLGEYAIEETGDEITEVSSFIKTVLESKQLTIQQIATKLSAGLTHQAREARFLPAASS